VAQATQGRIPQGFMMILGTSRITSICTDFLITGTGKRDPRAIEPLLHGYLMSTLIRSQRLSVSIA